MIKPTKGYVLLILEKEREEKTETGIYLPETKKNVTHQFGEVVEGNGLFTKGSNVIFKRWAGEELTWQGVDYLLVHETDIIAYEATT